MHLNESPALFSGTENPLPQDPHFTLMFDMLTSTQMDDSRAT